MILTGVDVVARAKNGTGKTGAFVIPMMQMIDFQAPEIQTIIIVHTKELAMQIAKNIKLMGSMMPRIDEAVMCSVGGVDMEEDRERLRKHPVIVVGTPARIYHFTEQSQYRTYMDVSKVKFFIMDEADKLIETEEFVGDVTRLLKKVP